MDALITLVSMLGCGAFWLLPTALIAAAIVDMVRVRAEWYWFFVVFFVPFFGALAYFALSYLPIFGDSRAISNLSPRTYQRSQARRRLREIQIQLQHWRGPALLAEAGAQYLALGKLQKAEDLLREAKAADADVKDVNFHFAQVLQVKGQRWREALPLLEELVELEPDARFGAARLALARCLDELGDPQRAEVELRAVLKKRSPPEARVRLARLLLARGDGREATELLTEVQTDAQTLPKYLYQEHRPWIRIARKLKASGTKLPRPKLEGMLPSRGPLVLVAVAVALLAVLGVIAGLLRLAGPMMSTLGAADEYQALSQASEETRGRLAATDRRHPPSVDGDDGASVAAALSGFLGIRGSLADACAQAIAAQDRRQAARREEMAGDSVAAAFGAMNQEIHWQKAKLQLGRSLAQSLETGAFGRGDFRHLTALADGMLLERSEARVLLLPEPLRSDYMQALATLEEPLPPPSQREWRRDVQARKDKARAKQESLEALAASDLAVETGAVLTARRDELESSMPARCIELLLPFLDPQLADISDFETY